MTQDKEPKYVEHKTTKPQKRALRLGSPRTRNDPRHQLSFTDPASASQNDQANVRNTEFHPGDAMAQLGRNNGSRGANGTHMGPT